MVGIRGRILAGLTAGLAGLLWGPLLAVAAAPTLRVPEVSGDVYALAQSGPREFVAGSFSRAGLTTGRPRLDHLRRWPLRGR